MARIEERETLVVTKVDRKHGVIDVAPLNSRKGRKAVARKEAGK